MASVSFEDIRNKQEEIYMLEETYYRQKREIEQKEQKITERFHILEHMVQGEREKMLSMLHFYNASMDDANDFFRECDHISDESRSIYYQHLQSLEKEKEESNRSYHRKLDNLENELGTLRRDYTNADK